LFFDGLLIDFWLEFWLDFDWFLIALLGARFFAISKLITFLIENYGVDSRLFLRMIDSIDFWLIFMLISKVYWLVWLNFAGHMITNWTVRVCGKTIAHASQRPHIHESGCNHDKWGTGPRCAEMTGPAHAGHYSKIQVEVYSTIHNQKSYWNPKHHIGTIVRIEFGRIWNPNYSPGASARFIYQTSPRLKQPNTHASDTSINQMTYNTLRTTMLTILDHQFRLQQDQNQVDSKGSIGYHVSRKI
jgi:hypothetical protein